MLLQELSENQDGQQSISTGYTIFLLVLYWVLNFSGQALVLIPQMVRQMLEVNENVLEINPTQTAETLMKHIYYPWTINLIQLLVFICILWLFKRKKVQFFSKIPLTKKEIGQIIFYGFALVGVSWLIEYGIDYFNPIFNTANQRGIEGIFANSSRLTMFVSLVILAPITEEVMFRGVFGVIFKRLKGLGFVVCAVVFTLFHGPTDILSFFVYFTMAVGLGAIYWKTERIEASIFAHMLNNLLGFSLMLINK